MAGSSLDPNACIADLQGWVLGLLKTKLAVDNSWEKFAKACFGVYSPETIEQFRATNSPTDSFVKDLISKNVPLSSLKYALKKANLQDILSCLQEPKRLEIASQSHAGDVFFPLRSKVTLSVNVTGIPPPSYQWYRWKDVIKDENAPHLTIENFGVGDEDKYCCRVWHVFDGEEVSLWSQPVTLHVEDTPPSFQRDLGSLNLIEGDEVHSVMLAGSKNNINGEKGKLQQFCL